MQRMASPINMKRSVRILCDHRWNQWKMRISRVGYWWQTVSSALSGAWPSKNAQDESERRFQGRAPLSHWFFHTVDFFQFILFFTIRMRHCWLLLRNCIIHLNFSQPKSVLLLKHSLRDVLVKCIYYNKKRFRAIIKWMRANGSV